MITMNRKKILYILNVDWFFVSHRLPIALEAIKQGYEVHIACGVTDKRAILESHGIIVHPLSISRSGVGLLDEFKTLKQLFVVIKSIRPDITHCVTIKPVLYGNIMARILGVPIRISSISGLGYIFIASGIKAKFFRVFICALYRLALNDSKTVIFQNSSDRNILKQLGAVKANQELFIRGSGVNLDFYPVIPEPKGRVVAMLVARLLIDKGVNEFAAAAKILKQNDKNIRMVLVGDIDLANPASITSAQLKEWIGQNIVEHWGYSNNVAETMAKANMVILPSYREGLPKSLIEAAACGRAVITTDVPGCRDAIEINQTGLLVPVKSVEPLVEAILTLASDVELRGKLALQGRQVAEQVFDINDVIKKHLEIYGTGVT